MIGQLQTIEIAGTGCQLMLCVKLIAINLIIIVILNRIPVIE